VSEALTAPQAWETEDGSYVAFNTHDPEAAYAAADAYNRETGVADFPGYDPVTLVEWQGAAAYWLAPDVDAMDEDWPEGSMSRVEVPGWTPYLVVFR